MGDLTEKQAAGVNKIVGADPSTGTETEYLTVTSNNEVNVSDRLDNGGEDTVKTITTTASEIFVQTSARTERKVLVLQGDGKFYFGYSNTTQSFLAFRNQLVKIRVGPKTEVWAKAVTGTVELSIGELS